MFILAFLLNLADARSVKVSFSPEWADKESKKNAIHSQDISVYERAKGVQKWHETRLDQHLKGSEQHQSHLQKLEEERMHLKEKLQQTGVLGRLLGRQKARKEKLALQEEILSGERRSYERNMQHLNGSVEQKNQAHQAFLQVGERRMEKLKKLSEMAEKAQKFDQVRNHEATLEQVQNDLAKAKLKHEEQLLQAKKRSLDAKTYLDQHDWPVIDQK